MQNESPLSVGLLFAVILPLLLIIALLDTLNEVTKDKHDVTKMSDVCLTPDGNDSFRLCMNLMYDVDGEIITIPLGFKTDLASVPRALWSLEPPTKSTTIAPAILHDYLYACHRGMDRKKVDAIFYKALLSEGNHRLKSLKYWVSVRLFGWMYFIDGACYGGSIEDQKASLDLYEEEEGEED